MGTRLVSAIYIISVNKRLLKPLTLELQHCVALKTETQADCLKFVRAPLMTTTLEHSSTELTIMEGGNFHPGNWYGSISYCFDKFTYIAVLQEEIQSAVIGIFT